MNSRQRRKSKRIWCSFLKNITKPLANLYSPDRVGELAYIWKEFTGETPKTELRWKKVSHLENKE